MLYSKPHIGKGRAILPSQKIHFSVAFKDRSYKPRAILDHIGKKYKWETLVGLKETDEVPPNDDWKQLLELDLFDSDVADKMMEQLASDLPKDEVVYHLKCLNSMTVFRKFRCDYSMFSNNHTLSMQGAGGKQLHPSQMLYALSRNIFSRGAMNLLQLQSYSEDSCPVNTSYIYI